CCGEFLLSISGLRVMTGPAAEKVGFECGSLDRPYALQAGDRNTADLPEFQREPLIAVLSCSRYPAKQQEGHCCKTYGDRRQDMIELEHHESVEDQHQQINSGRREPPRQYIRYTIVQGDPAGNLSTESLSVKAGRQFQQMPDEVAGHDDGKFDF